MSETDSLVEKLHFLRNKSVAHTDAELVKKPASAAYRPLLPPEDIDALLSRASAITAKYSLYFRGSTYGGIAGANDFEATLKWVRKALAAHDAEFEKEHERALEPGLL